MYPATNIPSAGQIDASMDALQAAMKGVEESGTKGRFVKFKVGRYKIRVLPNRDSVTPPRPEWWRQYGTHYFPAAPGGGKGRMYTCDAHIFGTACKACDEINKAKAHVKQTNDPIVNQMVEAVYTARSYIANFIDVATAPGKVQIAAFSKTLITELFRISRMGNPRFFSLDQNIVIHLNVYEKPGTRGLQYTIEGVEPATHAGIGPESLFDLDAVIQEEIMSLQRGNTFAGGLQTLAAPQPGAVAMLPAGGYPQITGPVATIPTVAPVQQTYVAPPVAPQVQTYAPQPQPVYAAPAAPVAPPPVYVAPQPPAPQPVYAAPQPVAPQAPVYAPQPAAPVYAPPPPPPAAPVYAQAPQAPVYAPAPVAPVQQPVYHQAAPVQQSVQPQPVTPVQPVPVTMTEANQIEQALLAMVK